MDVNNWIKTMRYLSTDFNYTYTEDDKKIAREVLNQLHYVDNVEMKDEYNDELTKRFLDYFTKNKSYGLDDFKQDFTRITLDYINMCGKDFSYIEEISTKISWHFKSKYDCNYSCTYCGKELKKTTGEDIYGINKYPGVYWKCPNCIDVYVGCHKGTEIPLGTVANKELRMLRNELHSEFDVLWTSGIMTRK